MLSAFALCTACGSSRLLTDPICAPGTGGTDQPLTTIGLRDAGACYAAGDGGVLPPIAAGTLRFSQRPDHPSRDASVPEPRRVVETTSVYRARMGDRDREWTRERLVEGHAYDVLHTTITIGSTTIDADHFCASSCADDELADWSNVDVHLRDDLVSMARGSIGIAYSPDAAHAGLEIRLAPLMRRVSLGGFGVGLALSYADFGPRQRASFAAVLEYDFSWLARHYLGGSDRSWQLALGADVGLGLAFRPTDFGHAVELGLALDPYLELRILPSRQVAIPVRVSIPLQVSERTSYHVSASIGVGAAW